LPEEWERIWKELSLAQFQVLAWDFHGRTERNHTNPELGYLATLADMEPEEV
jgi:hypothetical protein